MTQQTINTLPHDSGQGDPAPTAFEKVNANFTELYSGITSVASYGVKGDGVTDDTAALNTALQAGGIVTVPANFRILVDSGNITIPNGTTLQGPQGNPGQILPHLQATYNALTGCIILNSAYTIILGSGAVSPQGGSASISGLYILRKGLLLPTSSGDCDTVLAAYAGTAITYGNGTNNHGVDCYVGRCHILGFSQAISITSNSGRYTIERVSGDNTAGIYSIGSLDLSRVRNCHFWPFLTVNFSTKSNRSGAGFYFDSPNDWTQLENCFCYGYDVGFKINANSMRLYGCGADGNSSTLATTSLGFSVENASIDTQFFGCESSSHGKNFSITATGVTTIVGGAAWGAGSAGNGPQYHLYANNGRVNAIGLNIYNTPQLGGMFFDSAIARYNVESCTFAVGGGIATFVYGGNAANVGSIGMSNRYINGVVDNTMHRQTTDGTDLRDNRFSFGSNPQGFAFYAATGTGSSPALIGANQGMAIFRAGGYDGTTFQLGGSWRFQADGTPAAGSMPGQFILATTPSGSVTPVDCWTTDNAGNIRPAITGATNLTGGFSYIQAAAGAPTGVPSFTTNGVPMYYDKTNNFLYIYNGGWKKSTVYA